MIKMPTRAIENKEDGYWVEDEIEKRFFKNPQFCSSLKDYLFNLLSIPIEIDLQTPPKKNRWDTESIKYKIWVVGTFENKLDMQQAVSDRIKKFFQTIKSKSIQYNDDTVLKWFTWFRNTRGNSTFLQNYVNRKLNDLITIIEKSFGLLSIYSSPKELSNDIDPERLEDLIQHEIAQEIIPLPLPHERSSQLEAELKEIQSDETLADEVLIVHSSIFQKTKQKEIVLFGDVKKVNELKRKILNIIETNILITYKLNPIDTFLVSRFFSSDLFQFNQFDSFLETRWNELREIEQKYQHFGVDLRIGFNEFSAPRHLKDEIESSIQQLLSQSASITTKTFASIQLFKDIAEKEEKHLKSIARKNSCYIKPELKHSYQSHSVPKASVSNTQVSKSIITQSELFSSSSDVFKKMIVGHGSIELRTGDIALQKVDTIILPTTFNGLKEGVIDRAGQFDYENTHLQPDGTMYTKTDGGKLSCKRILFSNWLPTSLINNDQVVRSSIQSFISKSMEYTTDALSIAFAVPDSCTDESILAREMIMEAKRQLEINQSELKISFVLLPEQKTLYEQFSNYFETTYFDWITTIIEITLIGTDDTDVTRCQGKITKYLSRCISSGKIIRSNGIFQSWNQHLVNSFYKYCKDRCVLAKLDETCNEIEFIGPANGIQEMKKKFTLLSELVKSTSIIERPSSARSENLKMAKLYNIVVSYNRKDIRRCQRLINRLTEEGFSVGTDSTITELKSAMEKCDCIILCISENYYQSLSCIEEAKYAFQMDKKVFLVKIQNHSLFGWDDDLFDKKLFFQSFGSENYFDLEYGRLLIELLRYTKPGFTSLLQRRSSGCIHQTDSKVEHNKIENPYRKLPNIGKSMTAPRQLTFIEERWLRKFADIPKLNLSFYSIRRNDSSIEMPVDSYTVSGLCIRSILSTNFVFPSNKAVTCGHYPRPITGQAISDMLAEEDQTYGISTKKTHLFPPDHFTDDSIPRRRGPNYFDSYFGTRWNLESESRSEEQMKERQKFENPEEMIGVREKLAQYFMAKYKCYTKEELDDYLKFAQRMKDNTMAFEMFCSTNTIAN